MGLVGGVNVVVAPPAPVSVIDFAVRRPVTNAVALSFDPVKVLNSETILLRVTFFSVSVDAVVTVVVFETSAALDGMVMLNRDDAVTTRK
jgi:hypothetical protein